MKYAILIFYLLFCLILNEINCYSPENFHDENEKSEKSQIYTNQGKSRKKSHKEHEDDEKLHHSYKDKKVDEEKSGENDSAEKSEEYEASEHKTGEKNAKGLKKNKFLEKEGHKKGHKTKGYLNKFIKDEHFQEHKIYDVGDQHSGHYEKEAESKANYNKQNGGYKSNNKKHHVSDLNKFGNGGFTNKETFGRNHQNFNGMLGNTRHMTGKSMGMSYKHPIQDEVESRRIRLLLNPGNLRIKHPVITYFQPIRYRRHPFNQFYYLF